MRTVQPTQDSNFDQTFAFEEFSLEKLEKQVCMSECDEIVDENRIVFLSQSELIRSSAIIVSLSFRHVNVRVGFHRSD